MSNLDTFTRTLDTIPMVTPEVHFLLDEAATKLKQGQNLNDDIDTLRRVFIEIQGVDRDMVSFLQSRQERGDITTDEMLLTALYFLICSQLGPESGELRQMVYDLETDEDAFNLEISSIKMPENTRHVIMDVYNKIRKKSL